jgi:hypothetical protein|uniref:hypothetical protein n=1 Tax=Methylobacterium radiotolerans TaxID=31998 RepID=UPI002738B94A|nr:hypothetical protein [Methylobacterium radiotolerans]WKV18888.1 hypothetical protein [Methylobacterium radiotolerans JCM 2831]
MAATPGAKADKGATPDLALRTELFLPERMLTSALTPTKHTQASVDFEAVAVN